MLELYTLVGKTNSLQREMRMEKTVMTCHTVFVLPILWGRLFYVETLLDKGVYRSSLQLIKKTYIGTEVPIMDYTAGLGNLEVLKLSMQILLLGQLASVRTVNSQWGRRIQSSILT